MPVQELSAERGGSGNETQHYFLQNKMKHRIGLNYNGIYPARYDARLGPQKQPFLLRNLGNVISTSYGCPAPVSLVDVIVVKKFPPYFTELASGSAKADKPPKRGRRNANKAANTSVRWLPRS